MTIRKLTNHICRHCGEELVTGRWELGYKFCLDCGHSLALERTASFCVAPINKSNYTLITDPELLKQLNPKRTS
jgi:hypothetical protein